MERYFNPGEIYLDNRAERSSEAMNTASAAAGLLPVQAQFPQAQAQFRQVPNLHVAQVHAGGEMVPVRTQNQRQRAWWKRQNEFRRRGVVEAGGAEIRGQPACLAVQ